MHEESDQSSHAARLHAIHTQAVSLVTQLQALATDETPERPLLLDCIDPLQELAKFVEGGPDPAAATKRLPFATLQQRQEFGKLLRDKRNAAGLSRVQLSRKAKLSDATIKFSETARKPPSRATLIKLIAVAELALTWGDLPGHPSPPAPARMETAELVADLNCYVAPTCDPILMVRDLGRFLNGAGGHVEQTGAYLDHQSADAYLLCQKSLGAASLRASTPLAEAAQRIVAASGPAGVKVIALGSGDATLEVRLVQHLLEAQVASVDLCLLDISQPLLGSAYKRVADTLTDIPNLRAWGMLCNFHDLPLYGPWVYGPDRRQPRRRVFCMLGGTFANLDNEPRFFKHSLSGCSRGDLLLLDIQIARGPAGEPDVIKKRDKDWLSGVSPAQAAWLSGPIWRHCKDVLGVGFHWRLDTNCPLSGSYALDAVATVQTRSRDDRQFSMLRFRRYAPDKLAECLQGLGWDEILALPYGGPDKPSSLRLFCKSTEAS